MSGDNLHRFRHGGMVVVARSMAALDREVSAAVIKSRRFFSRRDDTDRLAVCFPELNEHTSSARNLLITMRSTGMNVG